MSKEAFYFSHDSNARSDEKILKLRLKHGWEGYGIFWALIEMLRDSSAYELELNFELIAFELRVDAELIKSIVLDFGLFDLNETHFYSISLKRRMELKEAKSKQARDAARKRWAKPTQSESNADALPTQSGRNAIKEKKEIKENEIFTKSGQLSNDADKSDSVLPNLDFTPNDFKEEETLQAWRDWLEYNYHQQRAINRVRQPLVKADLKRLATINGQPHEPTMRAIIKKCISMDWKNLQLTDDMKAKLKQWQAT